MTVYAVSIHKGGTGKTTSTVHIIGELKPDLIIEVDVHHSLSVINNLRPENDRWPLMIVRDSKELLKILKQYDDEGKTVLIDCGGFDADINRTACAVADVIIVPSNDDVTEQIGLAIFDGILAEISEKMGMDIKAHILMCKTEPNQKYFPDMESTLKEVKHLTLLNSRLSYRKGRYGFTQSLRSGKGITEIRHGRSSKAGQEVISLVAEIKNLAAE